MFSFLEDIYTMSGLSTSVLNGAFRLINLNNKCIYVEGYLKLVSVSSEIINIKLKRNVLKVSGANLKIKNMTSDTLMIVGDISSMECN